MNDINVPDVLIPDLPIAFNPDFVDLGIGVKGALFLSQCLYWTRRTKDKEGWFYKTNSEWESETRLTDGEQKRIRGKLAEKGYLTIEKRGMPAKNYFRVNLLELSNSLASLGRKSKLAEIMKQQSPVGLKQPHKSGQNSPTSQAKTTAHTITENTTENTTEILISQLPQDFGNSQIRRVVNYYSLIWEKNYGFKPTISNWGKIGRLFQPYLKQYTEYQIACLIQLYFEWRGSNGDDRFIDKFLKDRSYPIDLMPSYINAMMAFYKNVLRKDIGDNSVAMNEWKIYYNNMGR